MERERSSTKLTYADYVALPDDDLRHEIIDGEHYVTPSPNLKHQTIVGNIHGLIWTHIQKERTGMVFGAPFDVVFSHFDVVEPDVLYVSAARKAEALTAKNVQGAPDLVIEVGSPSTRRRDEKLKHQLYERFGVSEYWVVDPDLDVVKVYRLADGRYVRAAELALERDEILTTPVIPGLELPLARIFADSDFGN